MKKPIRYTAVCGLLSACLILLCSYRAECILAKETVLLEETLLLKEKSGKTNGEQLKANRQVAATAELAIKRQRETAAQKAAESQKVTEVQKATESQKVTEVQRAAESREVPEAQKAAESQAFYEIPKVQAGIGAYLEALEDLDRDFSKSVNSLATSASTIIELDASDYDCLLRIVESEAGICDQKGKVLVANVILNRVESEHFPDTVEEVVYQKKQFSPVENGTIDQVTVTEETKTAVSMALSGIDYSEGALFFAARKAADPKNMNWFDRTLDFLFEHDGHEFFTLR